MRRRARALLLAVTVAARVLDTQRAVSLPVDSERQRVVTVDASPLAVKRAMRRYDAGSHKYCGAVVAKAHRRHERNQDGLGAQVLRADQLAPLLLAHALTGLRIACRPHEWDFGDAYGEEGAMALFGCGRDDRGGMAGVGVFAASAALDRLLGVDEKAEAPREPSWVQRVFSRFQPKAPAPAPSKAVVTVVNPRISVERRDAFLAAVPLLKPLQEGEANASFACASFDVYCVKVSAAWSKNATLTSVAGAHSFQLVRKVLRPQFDLVKAARPRPLDVWGNATVRVALHVRRGDVMPVESAARGAGVLTASDFFRPRDPTARRRGRRLGPAPEGEVQGRRARRVLALPPGLPGEPRERDGARRRRLDRGPRGPARRRRRARRGRRVPRRPASSAAGDGAVERARRRARARPGRHGVGDGPLLLAGLERGRARRGARARRHRLPRGVQPRAGLRLGAAPTPDQDPGGPRGC